MTDQTYNADLDGLTDVDQSLPAPEGSTGSGDIGDPYFDVEVQLTGNDGNAFAIMGNVASALRREGVPNEVISRYREESMAGDYDALLQTAMRWVHVQ